MPSPQNFFFVHSGLGNGYFLPSPFRGIHHCLDFMNRVLTTHHSAYRSPRISDKRPRLCPTGLATYRRFLPQFASLYSRHFQFHPALEFFFHQYRAHPICSAGTYERSSVERYHSTSSDRFDEFIAVLRQEALVSNLKKCIADWESRAVKNRQRWNKVEAELFRRHGLVSTALLDLSYQSSAFSEEALRQKTTELEASHQDDYLDILAGRPIGPMATTMTQLSSERIHADRQRLFANLKGKRSVSRHLAGYAWHIDFNPISDHRLRVAFFFDGKHVPSTESLAQGIGRYWDTSVTSGLGSSCILQGARVGHGPYLGPLAIAAQDVTTRSTLRTKLIPEWLGLNQLFTPISLDQSHLVGTGLIHRRHSDASAPSAVASHPQKHQ